MFKFHAPSLDLTCISGKSQKLLGPERRMSCAECLPTKIQFLLILLRLLYGQKTSIPLLKVNKKIAFGPEVSPRVLRNARLD